MTSMMMLDITMEVRINKSLPLKCRPQAWLGHYYFFWELHLIISLALFDINFGKLYSFGLWAKFT